MIQSYPLPTPFFITDSRGLKTLVDTLRSSRLIGIDIESNGLFAYHQKVCLIQLSTVDQDFLIDPLAIEEMSPLGELTANPQIEFVFHAADYDLGSLKRDFGYEFARIFDTMMAVRILGHPKVGLANVLEHYFEVEIDKKHQKANWMKRPLSQEAKRYAQMDTHFLPALRDILYQELQAKNMLEEAKETFEKLCQIPPISSEPDWEGYWDFPESRRLSPRQIACLRELYLWREQQASRQDVPRYRVLADEELVRLAKHRPKDLEQIQKKRLLTRRQIDRYAKGILKAIEKGASAEIPTRPKYPKPSQAARKRYEKLRAWRRQRAEQRGVESDVIVPGQSLWVIAEAAPKTPEELAALNELGAWRLAAYGSEIIHLLQGE